MDQLTARDAALPVLTASRQAHAVAHLGDGCVHVAMLGAMGFAMVGGHSAARSLAAGLALTALAMALAPLVRGSWRVREHLLDLGVMIAVLLLPLLIAAGGDGGSMAVHVGAGMPMRSSFASEGGGPELIGTLIVPLVAVGLWAAARIVMLVVASRAGPPRSRAVSIATVGITAAGMVVMVAM